MTEAPGHTDSAAEPGWRSSPWLRVGAWLGLALALAWLGGLVWFAGTLDEPSPDPQVPTDAIIVLTGGSGRIESGLALLRAGKAKKLFVSGVHPGIAAHSLTGMPEPLPEWARCCVVLGHEAADTSGNATESAAWVRQEGFRSIRLVTANYHMRRSLLEFRRALPADIRIIPDPVFPDARLRLATPWRVAERVVVVEYDKYLLALLRYALLPQTPDEPMAAPP